MGQVHVRIPDALIRQLRQRAADEHVSLNTLLVAMIGRATADWPLTSESPDDAATSRGATTHGGNP